jgi:hypothetical protein
MSDYVKASLLLLAVSSISLLSAELLRKRNIYTHAVLIATFVVLDSIGLVLLPYFGLSLPYIGNVWTAYSATESHEAVVYSRHVLAHVLAQFVLVLGALPFLRQGARQNRPPSVPQIRPLFGHLLIGAMVLLGCYFYHRYFILGPGFDLLRAAAISHPDPTHAVTARSLAALQVDVRQGAFGAATAAYLVWPLLAGLSSLFLRLPGFMLVWAVTFLLSLAYALQTYQKAPILAAILSFSGIAYLRWAAKLEAAQRETHGRLLVGILMVSGIGGVLLYSVNFGLTPSDSIRSFVGRIFLVPANTEALWFQVYPDTLQFLGLPLTFTTNMEVIRRTAYYATGDVFSANASFIAVGWSGLGYVGIATNAALVAGYFACLTVFWQRWQRNLRALSLLLLAPSIFFLVSGAFTDFVFKGGLIPILMAVAVQQRPLIKKWHEKTTDCVFGAPEPTAR